MAVADRSNESEGEKLNLDSAHTAAICFATSGADSWGKLENVTRTTGLDYCSFYYSD